MQKSPYRLISARVCHVACAGVVLRRTVHNVVMNNLFSPLRVGRWSLPNRVVMAPLTRNRAPGAVPTPAMATYYEQRASAGLIISEATAISQQGQGYSDVPGLYSAAQVAGWKPVTQAVHRVGGRIVTQLWHVGRVSHVDLQENGAAPVAPSAIKANTKTVLIRQGVPAFEDVSEPRALLICELSGIVDDYRRAALAAMEAGFDGVEIHAANGYLLDQFLKTASNHRTDAYGGDVVGRSRLLLEVVQAVTAAIGADRTGIRLSPVSPANGVSDADPQALFEPVLRALGPLGLAYVHVIEGATGGARTLDEQPCCYRSLRDAWLQAGGTGAWMVNNGYDLPLAQSALEQGADLIAFGRPFIANPDLVDRLQTGGPFNEPDRKTFYGGGDAGYIDYPFMPKKETHP